MTKKKTVIITSIVMAVAIATGVGVTYYFASPLLEAQVDYNLDPAALEDDQDDLINRYENANGNYSSFKPYELANIALYNYDNSEYHYSTVQGSVLAAGVEQTIYGATVRSGTDFFNENISKSFIVQVAKRFYQDSDSVDTYLGSDVGVNTASWSNNVDESLTQEQYVDKWGKELSRSNVYIISKKTVLDSSLSTDENGNYVVTVNLDPTLSVVRYIKQMVAMSDLDRNPIFDSISISYTMDTNLKLLSNIVNEKYLVYKLGSHDSESTLYTTYYQDKQIEIPDLSTNFTYE